jgi:hypothetical protein
MPENKKECMVCHASSDKLPLLSLEYRNTQYFICPQHFPILIHHPERLVGILPGAENLQPHDHD